MGTTWTKHNYMKHQHNRMLVYRFENHSLVDGSIVLEFPAVGENFLTNLLAQITSYESAVQFYN